jgi:prepilin peptidase CpaA
MLVLFARPPLLIHALLLLTILPAALFDIRERRIPNWVTVPALLAAFALNVFLRGRLGLWFSAAGLGLALLIYLPLYRIRAMGAGDVKLMAAIGAAVGPSDWVLIFALTSIAGGVAAVVMIMTRGRLARTLSNVATILLSILRFEAPYQRNPQLDVKSDQGLRLPHAAVIACGTIGFLAIAARWP